MEKNDNVQNATVFFVEDPIERFAPTTQTPSTSVGRTTATAATKITTKITVKSPITENIKTLNTNTTLITKKTECSNIQIKQDSSDDNKNVIVIAVIASAATLINIILCTLLTRQVYTFISFLFQD